MPQTTAKDYAIFQKECEYWLDKLNLRTYDVTYTHSDADGGVDCCAWCKSDNDSCTAILGLSKTWDGFLPLEYQVRKFALHEVLELLFSSCEDIMVSRFEITKPRIETVKHTLIARVINAFFPDNLDKRKIKVDKLESPIEITS
jgi:hypothetical protein